MPSTPKIVTRSETTSSNTTQNLNKGSKLTFAEMDSNFIELKNGSIGIVGDDSTGIDIAQGSTLKVAGTGGIATSVSGDTLTVDASSIVTTSLGDLTANGSTLISPSNADITLDPAGTGAVSINADLSMPAIEIHDNNIKATRTNDDLVLETNNTGIVKVRSDLQVGDDNASGRDDITIKTGTNSRLQLQATGGLGGAGSQSASINIEPGSGNGTGEKGDIHFNLGENSDGSVEGRAILGTTANFQYVTLTTQGAKDLKLSTNEGTNSGSIDIGDGANGNISITPNQGGTGLVEIGNASTVSTGDSGGGEVKIAGMQFRNPGGLSNAGRTNFSAITIPFNPDGSTSSDVDIGLDSNADPFITFNTASTATGQGAKIKTNTGNLILQSGSERIELSANTVKIGNNSIVVEGNKISTDSSNEDIDLDPNGTGKVSSRAQLDMNSNKIVNVTDPASAQDAATKAYVDANVGSTGDITFVGSTMISPSNADITLNPAGSGKVNINAVYTLPNADGSANQVLGTNGSGVLSFRDPTAINIDGGVADSVYTSVPTIDGGTA